MKNKKDDIAVIRLPAGVRKVLWRLASGRGVTESNIVSNAIRQYATPKGTPDDILKHISKLLGIDPASDVNSVCKELQALFNSPGGDPLLSRVSTRSQPVTVKKLSQRELELCTRMKIDPKEYAINRAAIRRR